MVESILVWYRTTYLLSTLLKVPLKGAQYFARDPEQPYEALRLRRLRRLGPQVPLQDPGAFGRRCRGEGGRWGTLRAVDVC